MKKYKIQNRSQKNSPSCVPLTGLKSGFSPHDARAKYCTHTHLMVLDHKKRKFALFKLEFSLLVIQKKI
jgi:hypothetical protein